MTEQEFLALSAPEQTAIAAQHLMGFTWKVGHLGVRFLFPPQGDGDWTPDMFPDADGSEPLAADWDRFVPHYPISTAAAQNVLDALHLDWRWGLTNDTPDDRWQMRLRHRESNRIVEGMAETDALTICLTGLKAVGFVT